MTAVALYTRVSTAEQAERGYSIAEQKERLQMYAKSMNWAVYNTYTDAGYSGGSTDRPALQNLIRDVRNRKVDKVIVYKLDRLSRSQKDTLTLIEDVFLKYGTDFCSMTENFDTSTPFGRAMLGILAVFAQLEREQIKERVAVGREARAKSGKFHGGGNIPIGYNYIDGKLIPDPYEADLVRKIFQMAGQGTSCYFIAKELNEKGLTRGSCRWTRSTVKLVLTKSLYLGKVTFGGKTYDGEHEALITQEQFDAVQEILRDTITPKLNQNPGHASSYLAGLIFCKRCGEKYYKTTSRKKWDYYACHGRRYAPTPDEKCQNKNWKMNDLDSVVFGEIAKIAVDPDYISAVRSAEDLPEEITVRPKDLEAQIAGIDRQISRIIDLYSQDKMPLDILGEKIDDLNDRKKKLTEELARVTAVRDGRISPEDAASIASDFSELIRSGDIEDVRKLLRILIRRIEVDGEDVDIYWNF